MASRRTIKPEEKKKDDLRPHSKSKEAKKVDSPAGMPLFLKSNAKRGVEVGATNDPLEHAADATAERALRITNPPAASAPSAATGPSLADDIALGPGKPLDKATRAFFEPRLGQDFADVRIHTDSAAAESAQALGAQGYNVGRDIVFGSGQFAPDTRRGRQLLAHELAHVAQRQDESVSAEMTTLRRQVFGPASPTGAGSDFDEYILQFQALESAAIADGYGFNERITAFRKLYYDSASAAKTYAGAVVGGGVWNILIPGAASTTLPPSWSNPTLKGSVDYLKNHQNLTIAGKTFDIGHLFAGADAAKHPTSISVGAGMVNLRSNVEAATWIGDLGSVVTEYIHGSTASFRDTAMVRSPLLDSYYDGSHAMAGIEDMSGNADAYALPLDSAKSLTQNLIDYYAATTGGVNKRFTTFAAKIGLGVLTTVKFGSMSFTGFPGADQTWRDAVQGEVFNAALAYAGGKGWKVDVINVFNDPGPGILTPTFWEMYWNISGWVMDIFLDRMKTEVAKE